MISTGKLSITFLYPWREAFSALGHNTLVRGHHLEDEGGGGAASLRADAPGVGADQPRGPRVQKCDRDYLSGPEAREGEGNHRRHQGGHFVVAERAPQMVRATLKCNKTY